MGRPPQRNSDDRFLALLENISNGALVVDACGVIACANARAVELLGGSGPLVGASIFSLLKSESGNDWFESIEDQEGKAEIASCTTVNGKNVEIECRWCRVMPEGAFGWLMILGQKVDARTPTERDARLHHDLQNPIASILGFADILAEEAEESQAEFIGYIKESAVRLRELARQLKA